MELLIQICLGAIGILLTTWLVGKITRKKVEARLIEMEKAGLEDLKQLKQLHPRLHEAHQHSSQHRSEVMRSDWCGCFYCLAIFRPAEIEQWVDHDDTALCPKCGIDSVLGSASGCPITQEFLKEMQAVWFN
jgi:hypothetical protein